jgi:hypothetical protein
MSETPISPLSRDVRFVDFVRQPPAHAADAIAHVAVRIDAEAESHRDTARLRTAGMRGPCRSPEPRVIGRPDGTFERQQRGRQSRSRR